MGGPPLLLAMNGRGYTVLHVHNESSASGQAPEEEAPGSWQLLKLGKTGRHNDSSASGQAPGGGTWQTGAKVSAQARPSQWDSIRLVNNYCTPLERKRGKKCSPDLAGFELCTIGL